MTRRYWIDLLAVALTACALGYLLGAAFIPFLLEVI